MNDHQRKKPHKYIFTLDRACLARKLCAKLSFFWHFLPNKCLQESGGGIPFHLFRRWSIMNKSPYATHKNIHNRWNQRSKSRDGRKSFLLLSHFTGWSNFANKSVVFWFARKLLSEFRKQRDHLVYQLNRTPNYNNASILSTSILSHVASDEHSPSISLKPEQQTLSHSCNFALSLNQ